MHRLLTNPLLILAGAIALALWLIFSQDGTPTGTGFVWWA
jgi:hypothetical protein